MSLVPSLSLVGDIVGGMDDKRVGKVTASQVLDLDAALASLARTWTAPQRARDEYRASVPFVLDRPDDGFRVALAFAHSVVIPDPIDGVFFARHDMGFVAGAIAAELGRGATPDEAIALGDDLRVKAYTTALSKPDGLDLVRRQLLEAVSFVRRWREALDAHILQLVPSRSAIAALAISSLREYADKQGMIDARDVLAAIGDAQWEVVYEQLRGGFIDFNAQLVHARTAQASVVPPDEVSWRYLQYLVAAGEHDRVSQAQRAQSLLTSVDLPPLYGLGPANVLAIRGSSDEFNDWHQSLRALSRRSAAPSGR
jgi:hypothetical protein